MNDLLPPNMLMVLCSVLWQCAYYLSQICDALEADIVEFDEWLTELAES